ncbi:MAG: oligosaccharide flippase family protein [Arcobacter sp.]|nr:oligosaccharide flippase family protein [Campylobacterota bacterium]MBD3829319.1 oligosaccharide flippase family protein [Arcobacter sp.]
MLKKQVFISFLSVIIIGLTGLVSIPILTRLLLPEELGKLFTILAIVGIMQIFDALKPVIIHRLNDKKFSDAVYLSSFNKINWMFIGIGSSIIFFVLLFVANISLLEISLFILTFALFSLTSVQWALLEVKNHLNYTAILRTIGWVFAYFLFIVFAYMQIDIRWYILPITFMYLLLFLLFKIKAKSLFSDILIFKEDMEESKKLNTEIFKQALVIIKIQIYSVILLAMDKVIVPIITGYTNFAYYATQSELVTKSYLINTSVRRVLFPYLAKQNTAAKLFFINKIILIIFMFSTFLMLILSNYAEYIIGIYAGEEYKHYSLIFSILLFMFPANILGSVGVLTLNVNGDFDFHNKIYRNIAIISLVPFVLLTYLYGIYGAAGVLLLTRSVDLFTYFLAFSKYIIYLSKVYINFVVIVYFLIGYTVLFDKPELGYILLFILGILLYNQYRKVSIA